MNSSFTIATTEELTTEPVTLQEAKNYCKVSNGVDDDLILELITSARERLEKYTGIAFGVKELVCYFKSVDTPFEVPYGPYPEIDEVVNDEEDEVTYTLQGFNFITMTANSSAGLKITYTTGYEELPKGLKLAILKQVFTDYENRENYAYSSVNELSSDAMRTADPFKRNSLFGI